VTSALFLTRALVGHRLAGVGMGIYVRLPQEPGPALTVDVRAPAKLSGPAVEIE
jgi:hypothetical protein